MVTFCFSLFLPPSLQLRCWKQMSALKHPLGPSDAAFATSSQRRRGRSTHQGRPDADALSGLESQGQIPHLKRNRPHAESVSAWLHSAAPALSSPVCVLAGKTHNAKSLQKCVLMDGDNVFHRPAQRHQSRRCHLSRLKLSHEDSCVERVGLGWDEQILQAGFDCSHNA